MVPSSCQGLGEWSWKWLVGGAFVPLPPGTLVNHSLMDGNGETTIFRIKIWNHPTEIAIKKWMFRIPGRYLKYFRCQLHFLLMVQKSGDITS